MMIDIKDIWRLKLTKGLTLCVVAAMLAGCTAESGREHEGQVPIVLTASVQSQEPSTRAATNLLGGTTLPDGLQFKAHFAGGATTVTDAVYTCDGADGVTTTSTPYFTLEGTATTVHAFHPSTVTASDATFSVQADQSSDEAYLASDLLYATTGELTKSHTTVTANLAFRHLMSKVIVNVTAEAGSNVSQVQQVLIVGGYRTVSLGTRPAITLGTLSDPLSTTNPITLLSGGTAATANCAGLIPPQTLASTFLQVVTDAGTVSYTLPGKVLESGKTYTVNLTVTAVALSIGTATLSNWTADGSVTVGPTSNGDSGLAVDLGMTVDGHRIVWGNRNIGAATDTDYGLYFAWGEVVGYSGAMDGNGDFLDGRVFDYNSYRYYDTGTSSFTKYNTADGKRTLDSSDDPARVHWGGGWRMPTHNEIDALKNTYDTSGSGDYTWTWCDGSTVRYKGSTTPGWKIVCNKAGYTGNTLFLPAAGMRWMLGLDMYGSVGYYGSLDLNPAAPTDYANWNVLSMSVSEVRYTSIIRPFAAPIRPVMNVE